MKVVVYAVSAFFQTAMAGCAILDEYIAPVNAPLPVRTSPGAIVVPLGPLS